MIDDELAAPREEIRKSLLAGRPLENVALVDALPRQLAPLAAQLIAQVQELFLLYE